ncbi:ribonuclease T2 family protein [Novosphingobium sp. M1R2S20]|uniref:Ribonuclease T n=1 Tax=Novosphingobium rhizovicinum TaxID=3228928 RepID=A0ABV3RAF2_9SPHN
MSRATPLTRLIAVTMAFSPPAAMAQAYQCTPPQRVEPIGSVQPDGPTRRTAIGAYTLAASWSPDHCKTRGDPASMQCSGRHGRFGFILHGLWPEAAHGAYPQWCATKPLPSPQLLRRNLCMTPSARLLVHEWAKHGSCMAKTPAQYFKVSAILWRSIRWPDADRLSRREGLTAGDLRQAFVAANPAWKTEQVGILVSRSGWLREVRLCYSRRFLPMRCGARQFGPADSAPLKIWRGL